MIVKENHSKNVIKNLLWWPCHKWCIYFKTYIYELFQHRHMSRQSILISFKSDISIDKNIILQYYNTIWIYNEIWFCPNLIYINNCLNIFDPSIWFNLKDRTIWHVYVKYDQNFYCEIIHSAWYNILETEIYSNISFVTFFRLVLKNEKI